MKTIFTIKCALAALALCFAGATVRSDAAEGSPEVPAKAVTTADLQAAIGRAKDFLLVNQNSNGWWSTSDQPAVTGLVLTALNLDPAEFSPNRSSELNRAYDFILSSAKPDGSIQRSGMANYNTALCLIALVSAKDDSFTPVIMNARRYLASSQIDMGGKGTNDTPFDGGIGYGSKYQHSDMNNTLMAVEAMRLSEGVGLKHVPVLKDQTLLAAPGPDIDWKAVAQFVQNCQNLPAVNSADWVSSDPKDRGGFVYYPGRSNAGGVTNAATGRVALRSYGSMSYGGLLSYIYARVDRNDPRVIAVLDWLRDNYTISENPGMNQQGYYYYLHLMTKALTAAGVDRFKMAGGQKVDWRNEVARQLLKLQKPNGSWSNPEPRYWESDPVLVTTYAMMSLEMLSAHAHQK